MNADGSPSLRVQTVCVYSVRGLLESSAWACSASKHQHAAVQRDRIQSPREENVCPGPMLTEPGFCTSLTEKVYMRTLMLKSLTNALHVPLYRFCCPWNVLRIKAWRQSPI